jgi:hypothetical protein
MICKRITVTTTRNLIPLAAVTLVVQFCVWGLGDMHKSWRWIAAGIAATVLAGAVAIPTTPLGRRALRYAQRQTGWGAEGRRFRSEALWKRAQAEFAAAQPGVLGQVDYPSKAALLARREETLARARSGAADPRWDDAWRFYLDLLLTLAPAEGKDWLRAELQAGNLWHSDVVRSIFTDEELRELALVTPGWARYTILHSLQRKPDQAYFEQFYLAAPNEPIAYLEIPQARDAAIAVYDRLGTATRLSLVDHLHYTSRGEPDWAPWLARETDPAVRRRILQYQDNPEAYLASLEQDGALPGGGAAWEWERRAVHGAPDSWHARGIAAYEAVRSQPYWEIDRQNPREWGDPFYNCDREIPGWLAFLDEWGRHEAADDAAYRLARCYEITGQYGEALRWLRAAPDLGDGAMQGHASLRVVWILDVLLDPPALAALPAGLPAELPPAVAYTAAVQLMREGQYAEAVAAFDAALARWGSEPLAFRAIPAFRDQAKAQRDKAARLAALAATGTPEARYDLAALIYHDEFLFYNHLWNGSRQAYVMAGQKALQQETNPKFLAWVPAQNHLAQAVQAFTTAAENAPLPIREKAAYSRAMALLQLRDYGRDVLLWRGDDSLKREAITDLDMFLTKYPDSDLAPDALLSLAFVEKRPDLLEKLLRNYPESNAAQAAREYLQSLETGR